MARSRNIKPAFFKNDLLGDCDMMTRLLFIGLWTLADCNGKVEDRPKRIAVELFPYDSNPEMERGLTSLFSLGFIDRYNVEGVSVIQINSFDKHQNPHKNERPSGLPEKPEGYIHQEVNDVSRNAPNKSGNGASSTVPIRPITVSLNPITDSLNTDSLIDDSEKDQASNHSETLKTFSDFGFPLSYRTNPEIINGVAELVSRGLTVEMFTSAIQKSLSEKKGKGLPPWNFIRAISDSLVVESRSGITKQVEESIDERANRMYREKYGVDPDDEKSDAAQLPNPLGVDDDFVMPTPKVINP